MSFWLVLAGALIGFSAALFIAWRALQAYAVYEGMHVCACPLDGTPAMVKLSVWRAALSALRGRPALQGHCQVDEKPSDQSPRDCSPAPLRPPQIVPQFGDRAST